MFFKLILGLFCSLHAAHDKEAIEKLIKAGIPVATLSQELNRSTWDCFRTLGPQVGGTAETFETCLQTASENYYKPILEKVFESYSARGCVPQRPAAPIMSPAERQHLQQKLKEEFSNLFFTAKCQRCHRGIEANQYTLEQGQKAMHTSSHKELLSTADQELLRRITEFLK